MKNYRIPKLNCLRCGYNWVPRSASLPKMCPKCHSRLWNHGKAKK